MTNNRQHENAVSYARRVQGVSPAQVADTGVETSPEHDSAMTMVSARLGGAIVRAHRIATMFEEQYARAYGRGYARPPGQAPKNDPAGLGIVGTVSIQLDDLNDAISRLDAVRDDLSSLA